MLHPLMRQKTRGVLGHTVHAGPEKTSRGRCRVTPAPSLSRNAAQRYGKKKERTRRDQKVVVSAEGVCTKLTGGSAPKTADKLSTSRTRFWLAPLHSRRHGKETRPVWSTLWWPTLKDMPSHVGGFGDRKSSADKGVRAECLGQRETCAMGLG